MLVVVTSVRVRYYPAFGQDPFLAKRGAGTVGRRHL